MKFFELMQALAPLISDGKRCGVFVQDLLEHFVEYDDEDENILFKRSEDSFKSYYTGKRDISELSSAIMGHINKARFAEYIDSYSDDVKEKIYEALSPAWPAIEFYKVPAGVADLLESIVLEASAEKRGRKPSGTLTSKQARDYLKEEFLLDEASLRCPLCNKRLVIGGSKNPFSQFECQSIVPAAYNHDLKTACEATGFRFPEPNSLAGLIALCPSCTADYRSNPTPEKYEKLMAAKQAMKARAELADTLDRLDIEDGIIELLENLGSVGQEFDYLEATKNAIEIAKKIDSDEQLLANEVCDNVNRYYHFVQEQLRQLDSQGILDFEILRNQMRGCFLRLNKAGLSQSKIVEAMSKWLGEKTGYENVIAQRIVIAFFIQSCEVFNEIAE